MKATLRKATMKDADFLLQCRNEPSIKAVMFDQSDISLFDHQNWLMNCLASPKHVVFIAEVSAKPVGYVRAKKLFPFWELGWAIMPEYRGKGLATILVGRAIKLLPSGDVRAFIKTENVASQKLATRLGFKQIGEKEWAIQTPV